MARNIYPISYGDRVLDSNDLYALQKISDGSTILDFDTLHHVMPGRRRSYHYLATITHDASRNAKYELQIRPFEHSGVQFEDHGEFYFYFILEVCYIQVALLQCIQILTESFSTSHRKHIYL